jgi:glycosyltransferase involved in cell wall biosynthesis
MKTLTVCIPTYEMRGLGHIYLKESLDILYNQTYKDFEVVICDNSKNSEIKNLCETYTDKLDLHYVANPTGTGLSSNLNHVIKNKCATGKFIKILAQDDYLYGEKSLEILVNDIDLNNDHWIVTGCIHTKNTKDFFKPFYPRYNRMIHLGNNTIGGLDVLTIRNEDPLLFDESLLWLLDCEYYKRCYDSYGPPKIIPEILAVVRLGEHNITNTEATLRIRTSDFDQVLAQYETGISYWFYKIINRIKYPLRKIKLGMNK